MGLEGLLSKHRENTYRAGRFLHGIKVKNRQHPAGSRVLDQFAKLKLLTHGCAWNAVSAFANCGRAVAHVRGSYVPILSHKLSLFLSDERNFLKPLMRFLCDHGDAGKP